MNVTVSNLEHLKNIFNHIAAIIKQNKTVNIEFSQVKKYKTLKQLGFIFGAIISNLQVYYYDCTGENWAIDDLKEMIYWELGIYQPKMLPNGASYFVGRTLSKMDINEATDFINNLLNWVDNSTDCILSPDVRYTWLHNIDDNYIRNIELLSQKWNKKQPEYLSYLRKSFCINCGIWGCEAHHLRGGEQSGTALKSPDYLALSVCNKCHSEVAHKSEKQLTENLKHILNGLSLETFCKLCFYRYLKK